MNYFVRLFLLLFLSQQTFLLALDNEIVIKGQVLGIVSVDTLMLSKSKNNVFLFSNSNLGATIFVRELSLNNSTSNRNIFNNGIKQPLPLIYELFNTSSFLGTSPLDLENIILGIDISAH